MYLRKLFPAQSSELLNKRWVFLGELSGEALTTKIEDLKTKDVATLRVELNLATEGVQVKKLVCQELIQKFGDATELSDQERSDVMLQLTMALNELENDGAVGINALRLKLGMKNVTTLEDVMNLAKPTGLAMVESFRELAANPGEIFGAAGAKIMSYLTVAMGFYKGFKKKLTGMFDLDKEIPDEDEKKSEKPAAAPAAPAPAPPKPVEKPPEVLEKVSPATKDLSAITEITSDSSGTITYKFTENAVTNEYQVRHDDFDNVKMKSEGDSSYVLNIIPLKLPVYLHGHDEDFKKLSTALGVAGPENTAKLIVALVKIQQLENKKTASQAPDDIVKLVAKNYEEYGKSLGDVSLDGGKVVKSLVSSDNKIPDIVENIRKFARDKKAKETPAPTPISTPPAAAPAGASPPSTPN